ncbi:hypothetical protein LTR85_009222 [Meristemomyces frigidus]|nr:hypothetical protein LTR85_009222 [Meristemomyces frigidus]
MLNTTKLFGCETFSDVAIYYGESGKYRIHCHKVVLCGRSDYFLERLGQGGISDVAGHTSITLKDCNTEHEVRVAEAMLKFIYTDNWWVTDISAEIPLPSELDWRFHLCVAVTGHTYGIPELEDKAYRTFRWAADEITDMRELGFMMQELPKYCQILKRLREDSRRWSMRSGVPLNL